jgi:hypothetical protein
LKLITKNYQFTEQDDKLTGLFLGRDADFRTLMADIENQYEENLPTAEQLAEEVAVNYFHIAFKVLLSDLSDCYGYDPSYFDNLSED